MQTQSLWEHTLTFFPQFLATLRERVAPDATVAVVGASDGKFVLPLAAARLPRRRHRTRRGRPPWGRRPPPG